MEKTKEISVATYNIQFGIHPEEIITNIVTMAKEGVVLFCLQEIITTPDKEQFVDKILKALGHNWKIAAHVGKEYSRLSIGTCIIWDNSVLMLTRNDNILLPKIERLALHELLFYKLVGNIPRCLQRKAVSCYFELDKIPIRITCVHVDNIGGAKQRLKQINYLLSYVNNLPAAQHEILCGDFNTFDLLKIGYEKKALQKTLGNEFIDASNSISWSADIYNIDFKSSVKIFRWFIKKCHFHFRRRLDYIWVKHFEVLACKKIDASGSDHQPIIAKLKFK